MSHHITGRPKLGAAARRLVRQAFQAVGLSVQRIHVPGSATQPTWSFANSREIVHSTIHPQATLSPWLVDETFRACYARIREHTLVDIYRCYELWSIVKQLGPIKGCVLEVGVWRGGTGALLAQGVRSTGQDRRIFLADTFQGVVKVTDVDTAYVGGEHANTSVEIVSDLLSSLNLQEVTLLKGIFPDETSSRVAGPVAMLHCDVDVYRSAKEIVEWVIPRLAPGGLMVFDDYGFHGCEGITRYVNELSRRGDFLSLYNLNGHAVLVRR